MFFSLFRCLAVQAISYKLRHFNLTILDFIRTRTYIHLSRSSNILSALPHYSSRAFSPNMRDIKTGGDSCFSTLGLDGELRVPLNVQSTPEIEKKYVHRVYDAIAPHFSSTRYAKWPKVATFLSTLSSGSLVLDAGCGNGKYLGFSPDCFFIGCDISAPLITICSDKGHEVLVGDAVNLPYRSNFSDAAISIAVLHHLSTEDRRRKAIEELLRVVKRGGLVLITVWAVEQEDQSLVKKWTPLDEKYVEEWIGPSSPRDRAVVAPITLESIPETEENGSENGHVDNQQEYFVPWHLPYHRAEINGASARALATGLAKRDDKKGSVVYNRYYHVFGQGELERLVSGMENAVIVDRFYDKSNWGMILKKTS